MANERLREGLLRAGLTTAQLAEKIGVDPKTAERWITQGRVPFARHRHEIVELLGEHESYLWPSAVSMTRRAQAAESEILHVYPHRASVPVELWRTRLDEAQHHIDLLMYSGLFLIDQIPDIANRLAAKAATGIVVRILLGDPESAAVALRGSEEGIDDAIAGKVRGVLSQYRSLQGVERVDLRLHSTTLYASIYRFDDELFANTHVYGFPAAHAPVLHLRKLAIGILFDTYVESFKKVWGTARPAPHGA